MRLLLNALFIAAAWRWGDWRNWKKYQATILFYIAGSLLYNVLLYNYPMWEYQPDGIFPNHTLSAVVDDLIAFPCTVLLYLPHFPQTRPKQIGYILLWGAAYTAIESVMNLLGLIVYHRGWNFWVSALFDIFIFFILIVHYKKPLLAYAISLGAVIGLFLLYKVPISSMK